MPHDWADFAHGLCSGATSTQTRLGPFPLDSEKGTAIFQAIGTVAA